MSRLFLILGRSRTGSNMVIRILNQHDDIVCRGEIFRRVDGEHWRGVLDEMERSATPWMGFKMFYYHGIGDGGALWRSLAADTSLPVVHLKRWNVLRTAVSRKMAKQSGRWFAVGAEPQRVEKVAVTFTRKELERDFELTRAREVDFTERFASHPTVEIEYADLAADPLGACMRVTDLLGLAPLEGGVVKTRKQNPEPLTQLIGNYRELASEFASTPWAPFFEN